MKKLIISPLRAVKISSAAVHVQRGQIQKLQMSFSLHFPPSSSEKKRGPDIVTFLCALTIVVRDTYKISQRKLWVVWLISFSV